MRFRRSRHAANLVAFSARQAISTESKTAIGGAAAALVKPRQIVFVDGGATTAQRVRHPPADLRATVVTHGPRIALELIGHPGVTVELIGGLLFKHSVVAVGVVAIDAIQKIRPDVYFMGVTGVDAEFGLTTGDSEEAAVKRTLRRLAAETVVLASNEKLGAVSPCFVATLAEMDALAVNGDLPAELAARVKELGVAILKA